MADFAGRSRIFLGNQLIGKLIINKETTKCCFVRLIGELIISICLIYNNVYILVPPCIRK